MKNSSQQIQKLLIKYRENRCSREEYEELIRLAQESGHDQVIREVMQRDWAGESLEIPLEPLIQQQRGRRRWYSGVWKAAAAIVLLLAAGVAVYQWMAPDQVAYATGNGEVKEIILPDGSEVTLNANSELTWVPAKNGDEDRMVELTGEAFFHVTKDSISQNGEMVYRGFQVQTPLMAVHVLGTSFNVAARKENTVVFLQEGSLEVQLPDQGNKVKRMVPGDKVIVNNKSGTVTEKKSEDLSTSASWVTGILKYHDKSLGEVLQNLSELFGVTITCENTELQMKKINLGVPYMDWDNTKRALEMAIEVEFRKDGDRYKVVPMK